MEEALARLTSALSGRYRIEQVLGRGGMSTVYLARDLRHDRPVALKTIRSDLSAGAGVQRFLREIEIGAQLLHPHIVPLFDSGLADGMLFYVMPFIEGDTLEDRLAREGQLPVEETVRIACEVADALTHAHLRGVIHRDIKPGNVLISAGHALVADFGIASALTTSRLTSVTSPGFALGTPAYMSPEQSEGVADARSDIYSLGCVLYEMLVGEPPFTGRTIQAVLARHSVAPVPSIEAVRPAVPAALEAAVVKALAKLPVDRFSTAAEFSQAISRAASAAGALRAPRTGIAVLPFVTIGGGPEDEYFADGLTEELITALSRVRRLRVASRTSTFAFKGKDVDVRVLGERLSVGTVIDGSIRRDGNGVRVVARLSNAADGLSLWSGAFRREVRDVFALQEDLARGIVQELRATLSGSGSDPLILRHTDNLEAYDAYWRGRYFWNLRTPQGLAKSIECYKEALARDGEYAVAYAGLADALIALSQFQLRPPRQVLPEAEAAAMKALELDPDLAEAHTSLAHVLEVYRWRWFNAEAGYRRAIETAPQYATAHAWYSDLLQGMGRMEEAAERMRVAQTLEPLSVAIDFQAATLLYRSRRFEESIARYERILEMAPGLPFAHFFLALSHAFSDDLARAESILRGAMERMGPWVGFLGGLGLVLGRAGREREARELLDRIIEREKTEYVAPSFPTLVHLGIGDREGALTRLEYAFQERSLLMQWLEVEPFLDPVRDEPRFTELVKKVHG